MTPNNSVIHPTRRNAAMPNYIQLRDKNNNATPFAVIDEQLCTALNVPCDANKYYCQWYEIIGYSGKGNIRAVITLIENFPEKLESDVELIRVLTWLDENYTLNAWAQR